MILHWNRKSIMYIYIISFSLVLSRVLCQQPMKVADKHQCVVHVSEQSIKRFNERLENGKSVFFFQTEYDSKEADDLTKSKPDDHFANPNEYMWLYDGEKGLPVYMTMPYDFEVHSLFILREYTSTLTVRMNVSESCNESNVTRLDFLRLVFRELIKVVSEAKLPDKKTSAFICYDINNRKNMSDSTFRIHQHIGLTQNILLRYCCKVNDTQADYNNTIDLCRGKKINTDFILTIQTIAASFAFLFFPLIIGFISKAKLSPQIQPFSLIHSVNVTFEGSEQYLPPFGTESSWLNEHNPYYSFGIFVKWLFLFENRSTFASRIRRSFAVFSCLLIIFADLLLQYSTMKKKLRSYLDNNMPLGYRSMMFGFVNSAENTGYFFGGPFVWYSVFLIFGLLFINIPDRICETIAYSRLHQRKTWTFLMQDIEMLQRFGRLNISNVQDYDLLHAILKSSLLTALNPSFWYAVIKRWFDRCKSVYNYFSNSKPFCLLIGILITFLCTFIFSFLCIFELLICIVYYGFPFLQILFAIPYSYTQIYMFPFWRNAGLSRRIVVIICLVVILQFYICFFLSCLNIFVVSFHLINTYVIYITIALIAKTDAIAFVILLSMFFYFLVSIDESICETYLSLQKFSTTLAQNVCQDFVYIRLGERFIYRNLFERIVKEHHPIRYEVAKALIKLTVGAYVLACCAYTFQNLTLNMSTYIKIGILIFTSRIPVIMSVLNNRLLETRWKVLPIVETIYIFQQENNFPNNLQMVNCVQ